MEKKKILVLAHYFYPDVASTGQILTELCEKLQDKFDVTVVCTVPSYTGKIEEKYKKQTLYFEKYQNINVIRVKVSEFDKSNKISRIRNILDYFFHAKKAIRKCGKQDLIYTISQPPILGGLLGVYAKRKKKAKLVYNIQDFNPEQTMAVKYSNNKLVLKILMYLDKRSCKKSDLIITVGRDMQKTLENRFNNKNVPNNVVINNWINEKEVYPVEKENEKIIAFKKQYNLENKFIIMYSGNIGLYYDLENIIKIMADYQDKDVAYVFVGEGSVKNKLVEYVEENKLENFYFIPYQPKSGLVYSLNSADIHLVTNAKGIKGVSVPSKIYGVMATNVPILGILEEGSEAYQIIKDSNCGIIAETGNYEQIRNEIKQLVEQKHKYIKKYNTGRKYLEEHFTKDKSIHMYIEQLIELLK